MEIQVTDVVSGLDIFSGFDEEHVLNAINVGKMQANADSINIDGYKMAVVAYARHLLYIDYFMSTGGVTSSSMLGVSETIVDKTANDPYLQQYQNIANLYGTGDDGTVMFL